MTGFGCYRPAAVAALAIAAVFAGAVPGDARTKTAAVERFKTESEAKNHCPGDAVVWLNRATKKYHHAGTPRYGKTMLGGYACEKDASSKGYHAAKREKRPG